MAKLSINLNGLKAFAKMRKQIADLEKRIEVLEKEVAAGTTTDFKAEELFRVASEQIKKELKKAF